MRDGIKLLSKIIMDTKATSCLLDPIPTSFLKMFIDILLPILTHIINLSLKECSVPPDLKMALIIPLVKKLDLDPELHLEPPIFVKIDGESGSKEATQPCVHHELFQ